MNTNNKHCCKLMSNFIKDPRVPINYSPKFREYYIPLIGLYAIQLIDYCPWCGIKLPEDLRDYYFDILENEYNIERTLDIEENKNIPKEFKSDEWWRKRNL